MVRLPRRLLVLALLTSSVWLSAAPARGAFCDTTTVRDYAKALKGLPPVPQPPVDEHLSFAPARVFLNRHARGPLQVGPGERGFVLSFSPYSEGNSASRRVGWQVTSRLVKIDRRGRPLEPPQTIERHVKRVPAEAGVDFGFEIPGEPAIYRLEILFEGGSGKRLARFGENFQVLRPSKDVGLVLYENTYRRGEFVRPWLVNRGVAYLSFGLGKAVEYWDGVTWTAPPVRFPDVGGPIPAIGLGLGPGERSACWGTTIPPNATPGLYRFSTEVDYSTSAPFGRPATPLGLSAEFTVTE